MSFDNLVNSEEIQKKRQEIIDKITALESETKEFQEKLAALDQLIFATQVAVRKFSILDSSSSEKARDNQDEEKLVKKEVEEEIKQEVQNGDKVKVRKRRKLTAPKQGTWTGTILEILKGENRGFTHTELKTLIKETSLGDKLNKTEKSFYGAIEKLSNRALINKHNGKLYSLEAFAMFKKNVEAGIEEDVPAQGGRGKPSALGQAIKDFLEKNGGESTTKEIKESMRKDERFVQILAKHHSFLYNVVANLVKKKELIKEGKKIILVK